MPPKNPPNERIHFGPFVFLPETGELWRGDEPVKLQPQPARLLALLVERSERVVSREEIQEHLWGDAAVDAEAGVNFAVRRVREALGETADESRYVETLPRLGYRFIGRIETQARQEAGPPPLRRTWLGLSAAGLFGLMVLGLWSDPSMDSPSSNDPPAVSAARDAYLQGMYLLRKGRDESRPRAASFFREALATDPDFAPAYVQLEVAERSVLTPDERQDLLRRALALDPQLAEAHLGQGWLELGRVRPAAARDSFEAAVQLDPSLVEALHGSALAHGALGDFDVALPRVEQALVFDPGATMIFGDAFLIYFWADRPVQAVAQLEEALRLEPGERGVRWAATSYLAMAGRWYDAAQAMEVLLPEGVGLEPAPDGAGPDHWRRQVEVYYEKAVDRMMEGERPSRSAGALAESCLALGRPDEALDWLERAADQEWYGLPYLGVDPRWDGVRSAPRFEALLERLGLEDHRRSET